ncbi:uncharacterized protein Bfra_008115 [Botrytis fragariae]|uniref:Uncharacterized protein n=1 Tax=Botrytis fragariae TaxID=1964551 RepID=A0A8H6AQP0_9HELO|nr:uncharacterized protein Bfra_008115 [Botrytis fragariae]KAF5871595.1 hypothetical protein Bfra_008115 [Botrytis fragariae]
MPARKKTFRQGASCEPYHTTLSFQEDLQPSFGPSRSPHPSQPCPPRRVGSCFGLQNPDGACTCFRDCSEPGDFSHPNNICPPRHIQSCIRKKHQDDLYNFLGACDEESVADDDAPGTRIPIFKMMSISHCQSVRISVGKIINDKGENVLPPPSCSLSRPPDCPPQDSFYNSFSDQIDLLTEIHRLHERIDSLENNIPGHVKTTAYCRCSCHRSTRPKTPPPDNYWHENESQLFPDPRNDWDESGEPGVSTPVV